MAGSRKRTNIDKSKVDPRVRLLPKDAGIPKYNLKKELDAQDLTQVAFAAWMGTDQTTVSKWISGARYMTDGDVVDASFRLGCSPMYLLDLTGMRTSAPDLYDFGSSSSSIYASLRGRLAGMVKDYESIVNDPDKLAGLLQPARTQSIVTNEDEADRAIEERNMRRAFREFLPLEDYERAIDSEIFLKSVLDGLMRIGGDHRDLGGISHLLLDRINSRGGIQADEFLERMWYSLLEK